MALLHDEVVADNGEVHGRRGTEYDILAFYRATLGYCCGSKLIKHWKHY